MASGVTFEKIEIPDSIKPIIENLKFYGAEYAVCYWIPHKGDDFTFADMQRGVKVFNEAGKKYLLRLHFLYTILMAMNSDFMMDQAICLII